MITMERAEGAVEIDICEMEPAEGAVEIDICEKEPAEGAVEIDICEAVQRKVLSSVQRKLNAVRAADNFTIFRVPTYVRQSDKDLYEPQMVAIGPYGHRDKPSLRAMEEHKWRYVQDFLSRRNTTIEDCIALIQEVEPLARLCYLERVELSTEKFVEMLLLDGCFILEFLIKWNVSDDGNRLFPMEWSVSTVDVDLLLLENQIPLFVLEKLFKIGGTAATLTELLVDFLRYVVVVRLGEEIESSNEKVEGNKDLIVPGEAKNFNHLLHFYYRWYVTKPQTDPTGCTDCGTILKWLNPSRIFILLLSYVRSKICGSNTTRLRRTIPSATELLEAGVTIKKKKKKKNQNQNRPSSFLDVTFCPRDGVIEIPFLSVEYSTLPRFSNLVALEQCGGCNLKEAYMSSYAAFMNCLVNTPEDEAILRQHGILENNLASDEHLVVFFNQLSEWITVDFRNHYLAELFREVGEYCDSAWHKWRAKLVRDYFNNPWAIISLIAALVVLILTFLQTVYSILSYDK